MFFERRMVIVGISAPHNESLFRPTAVWGRGIASPRRCISPSRRIIVIARLTMVAVRFTRIPRLTNAAIPVGRKGHDPRHLLDLQLLAGPAQAFAQDTALGHGRTRRAAGIHSTGPPTPTLTPNPAAARSAVG
jgi:hypothetical protein